MTSLANSLHRVCNQDYSCAMNIAFIPAKGKSSRVPKKNLQVLGNKSLVRITLEFAEGLELFDYIYLSTDSVEIVASATGSSQFDRNFIDADNGTVFHARNKLFIHKRREGDSEISSRTIAPLLDCLKVGNHQKGFINILQPTSPFRSKGEYQEIYTKLLASAAQSAMSVKQVQGVHPLKCFQLKSDGEIDLINGQQNFLTTPMQELPPYYVADGAYYMMRIEHLLSDEQILSKRVSAYVRSGFKTLNIDTLDDLELAKAAVESRPGLIESAQIM